MESLNSTQKAALAQGVRDISASRYTSGAALVLFLCDTIHNLGDDITYVLPSTPRGVPAVYVVNRLFALFCLVVVNIALCDFIPALSNAVCQVLLGVDLTLGVISIGLTDALVTFEVWRLWDRNAAAGRFLLAAFLVTSASVLGCALVVDILHLKDAKFEPLLHACILLPTPKHLIAALYGSGLFFEFAVFAATFINVFHKPRNSHTKLATALYRDGCLYFVAVSALRLTNTVVAAISRESSNYLVNHLVWALVLILLNRLVRNQCKGRRLASIHESKIVQAMRYSESGVAIDQEVDVELDTLPYRTKQLRTP
ncbi:hypothetical protein AURDEDRAFT_111753 [Auricularia subglabra TFB-10046 SS5]|nr:hypothetical protein AURDEDRAFT_111753 [Auricularia subglabra TFB-10046 SS5]